MRTLNVKEAAVAMALAFAGATGCYFDPPTPPFPPLDDKEAGALFKCQNEIRKAGAKFRNTQLKTLEQCVTMGLKAQLAFENGVIEQAKYDGDLDKAAAKCATGFAKITQASTKLVDAVIKKCTPVAAFVLGSYDALRHQALAAENGQTVTSIENLAGRLCTVDQMFAILQLSLHSPRAIEILGRLDENFVSTSTNGESASLNLTLDPRCLDVVDVIPF